MISHKELDQCELKTVDQMHHRLLFFVVWWPCHHFPILHCQQAVCNAGCGNQLLVVVFIVVVCCCIRSVILIVFVVGVVVFILVTIMVAVCGVFFLFIAKSNSGGVPPWNCFLSVMHANFFLEKHFWGVPLWNCFSSVMPANFFYSLFWTKSRWSSSFDISNKYKLSGKVFLIGTTSTTNHTDVQKIYDDPQNINPLLHRNVEKAVHSCNVD